MRVKLPGHTSLALPSGAPAPEPGLTEPVRASGTLGKQSPSKRFWTRKRHADPRPLWLHCVWGPRGLHPMVPQPCLCARLRTLHRGLTPGSCSAWSCDTSVPPGNSVPTWSGWNAGLGRPLGLRNLSSSPSVAIGRSGDIKYLVV